MSEEKDDGSNPQLTTEQRNSILADLDRDIAADAAEIRKKAVAEVAAPTETKTKQNDPTPEKGKEVSPQQNQTDGDESLEKIQEDIGHLEKGIKETADEKERLSKMSQEEKVAHFLKVRKEKRREYTQGRQELAKERETVTPQTPQPSEPAFTGDLTPEFETKVLADLEKSPVKAIVQLARAIARQELDQNVKPALSDWQAEKARRAEEGTARELAELSNDHPWVLTEGISKLDQVLEEKPWLKQSPTPYKDAARFLDISPSKNGTTTGSAQAGSSLPILGSGGVVPPSASDSTAAIGSSFNDLDRQLESAIRSRNWAEADKVEAKIRKLLGK